MLVIQEQMSLSEGLGSGEGSGWTEVRRGGARPEPKGTDTLQPAPEPEVE